MCESSFCSGFLQLLLTCEQRVSGHKKVDPSYRDLSKNEVDVILGYFQLWPQRQCMCCYRDLKNFDRFNFVIRSLIYLIVSKLKDIKTLISNTVKLELKSDGKINEVNTVSNDTKDDGSTGPNIQESSNKSKVSEDEKSDVTKESTVSDNTTKSEPVKQQENTEELWILPELEKVLLFISKIFLLNFPLYVAHKHGVHGRIDEITQQEAQSLSMFCDIHDSEIPVYLYRNVTLFCTTGGFGSMAHCFELADLPVSTAHACTVAISNIKLWLNYRSILQLFVPLRIKVLQYMCKLSDQDLRSPATKSMADFMWAAIKDPLDSQITFDTEGLALAFKYFTSSTLTMRLAGMSQINAHINLFNEICTTETVAEVEVVGRKLADWLSENQILSHLFGPNLHVEVIKQSQVVLNFLAVENQITEDHITLIWQAAQLKHCSKPIYDILPSLVKNLAPTPAAHLYSLLSRLDPKEHTEQSIYIVSALTKLIWARDRSRQLSMNEITSANMSREITEIPSSSENSVSVDGTNSEDDHPDEDSSEGRKSPIDVDGSDSGAPPCKQARHIAMMKKKCYNEQVDNVKVQPSDHYDIEKEKRVVYPILGHHIEAFNNATSSDECMEVSDNISRKKYRKKRRKMGLTRKEIQEMVESISDGDSNSDQLFGGSDCSESHIIHEQVLERMNKDESFFRAIQEGHLIDFLQAAENERSSSPLSNKSEKNMADFDDEDSPCDEEMAQLAASAHCIPQFSSPRSRPDVNRSSTPNNVQKAAMKNHLKLLNNDKIKIHSTNLSSPIRSRSPDICQPGSTLLWDLLQDDKIGFLGESLALETEKALGSLLCFHTEKIVRKRFIEASLANIANNRSVIVSLRLIPKLLASFQQFRDIGTHQVTTWAEKQHKMMHHFFNNLKCYSMFVKYQRNLMQSHSSSEQIQPVLNVSLVRNQNGDLMYSHTTQIQVRLQFLASIFCDIGSPKNYKLTNGQVDVLWACLSTDSECADCLFAWLQGQAKGGAQHALGANSLQHIYLMKWPELKPENISMVALTLFQQLFILGLSDELRSERADVIGMDNLWKIALRANDTEVSMAAIQYINTYYMEHQLKNEKEFVAQCMSYLTQAAEGLNSPEIEEKSIMCVQRALMLLNTHLETFRRRYAYHLRRWALDGKGIGSHSDLRCEGPGPPIKIILQPGGLPEKSYLHLCQTDLIADLKAEIAKWWETLQGNGKQTSSGTTAPVLGNLLSEGPLRIITQGQEITSEYDERSLIDVGFKDNQMVYVSLGGRGGRRRDHTDHPSMLPAPSKDCLPTVLLLQPPYFEQLFKLMQTLGDMKLIRKGGNSQHTQAQVLSRRVWDILAMLPTSPTILEIFKNLSFESSDEKMEQESNQKYSIKDVLEPINLQKFMYSLHIVESLCKSKFAANVKAAAAASNAQRQQQLKLKLAKYNKEKVKKSSPSKDTSSETSENDMKSGTSVSSDRVEDKRAECDSSDGGSGSTKMNNVIVGCGNGKENGSTSAELETKTEESAAELKIKKSIEWSNHFIKNGGLKHLYDILMSGVLQRNNDDFNEWRHDCLCSLLRILCLLGVEDLKQEENVIVIPKLNEHMLRLMDVKQTIERISSILNEAAVPLKDNHYKTGFWGRSQVVNFAMNLLVCFAYSSQDAREALWHDSSNYNWLQKLILDDPDPHVRRESCAALYRLCMGNSKTYGELMIPLLVKLIGFLAVAEKMKTQTNCYSMIEEGKEPYGQACRDYFWLLGRLVDNTTPDLIKSNLVEPGVTIDIEALCQQVSKCIMNRDYLEIRHLQDDGLVGLLNLMANLVKYDPPFKFNASGQQFIGKIFECLFALPTPENRDLPKCKSQGARAASYDLLIELSRNAPNNYLLLHSMLLLQHRPGPHSPYPWDYWPREDGRSECGYVGLTNLGATCYMASCIQHIFMMPQARESILSVPVDAPVKHKATLYELQKMFAYLMESERKAYNPRSFCRVYQMDHQPLNTGEQKDMAEFFIDLVSKLEEMTPDMKSLVKRIFCGVISNNVVSLDCGHVSRTLEEFYTVRCQVADMRNLQESLDEVTVKDTLEGDNMYTCSQCGRKVRAEKRACFKKLPQILCFNTMRYTFNMVTMLKEKVNTHFSFPMRLDMSGYVEKTLMPQHYQEEKLKSQMRRKLSECENNQNHANTDGKDAKDATEKKEKKEKTVDDEEVLKQEQLNLDEEDSEDFNENYEYDLVGVTVHTGTADGGHYYSFIKERDDGKGGPSDRWFLFNDAEVKLFDPSQIAAECFGGEMTSKTYDSVTEKYLDFSFEKTNSAYMLFYEWRSSKGGNEQRDQCDSPTSLSSENQQPSCSKNIQTMRHAKKEVKIKISHEATTSSAAASSAVREDKHAMTTTDNNKNTTPETESSYIINSNLSDAKVTESECDIESKSSTTATTASAEVAPTTESTDKLAIATSSTTPAAVVQILEECAGKSKATGRSKRKSLLNKELEEWIWQDNRHYLEDRNIFEHTYFNFMWQICGHIPQSLMILKDITNRAAQLSVSFFIETFIHAKEKPTMVLWVELLTKQFNASEEACEWFLRHMSKEPWWPVQVLIQCPNQMVRQMFQRLVIHVIQRLRQTHSVHYMQTDTDVNGTEIIGDNSCVTKFIKSLILLMENGAKAHLRHLSEFFGLLYEFSRMGEEETKFLLHINVIRSVSDFYLGHKTQDCIDTTSDNDDNSSDEALSVDKTRPVSLDKMIALVASLVERSRGPDFQLQLSARDYNAIAGGKSFPFLYQQIKDNINPNQTRLLIYALCRYDEHLAGQIIAMLFTAVTKHTELCGPFFKLLTLLTESSSGPSGLPCFSQLVLQRVWEAAEYCPQPSLEWLAIQAPRNKVAHAWILQSAENWVEQFLIAHNNVRVRNAAANLLVSLVPSQSFRSNYRTTHHKMVLNTQQREISGEAQLVLHTILNILLRLLRPARNYTDISNHGSYKLTSYFTLMSYCMITKTEKVMLGPHIRTLWDLFHPKLSEPSVPAHHNKQALLAFWYHATNDCPDNAALVANNSEITKNIAFNYILADHDDSEVVTYNRSMLPVYYGLLRLCCQQSRSLTRQLAGHQNLQWAFKNITPHPTQYPLAVEELFKLMSLFVTKYPDSSQADLDQICLFRRQTLSAYLSGLDARVSWNTLVSALRILVDTDEDRLFFVSNGGLTMCFEALLTLHSMYHEATACHVTEDLQDLLREIVRLLNALRQNCREQKKRHPPPSFFKGLPEIVRRLATLLNTFNPPEMRTLTLDVLKELVRCIPSEVINILTPLLTHCHTQNQHNSMGPLGTFFPRRNSSKSNNNTLNSTSSLPATWPPNSKNIPRPPRPLIQMNIPRTNVFVKGVDKEFDVSVERFYKPYHTFLDVVFRMAVTINVFNEALANLSLLVAIEAVGWHFNMFPMFWVGIYQNKTTNRYAELLINNHLIHEYIDKILKDERQSLNDSIIANFVEIYYSKVTTRISIPRLLEAICSNLVKKDNLEDICGDLHAIRIIGQTGGFPQTSKSTLQNSLHYVLAKNKDLISDEESPPKKRKLDTSRTDEDTSMMMQVDPKPVVKAMEFEEDEKMDKDECMEKKDVSEKDVIKEMEIKPESIASTSTAPQPMTKQTISLASLAAACKNDLIKDIESHIEIIFECLDDELDENIIISSTASSANTLNTTSSSQAGEIISISSDLTPPMSEDLKKDTSCIQAMDTMEEAKSIKDEPMVDVKETTIAELKDGESSSTSSVQLPKKTE